jgi:hypothetical protein
MHQNHLLFWDYGNYHKMRLVRIRKRRMLSTPANAAAIRLKNPPDTINIYAKGQYELDAIIPANK